jgi:hypothetical protein
MLATSVETVNNRGLDGDQYQGYTSKGNWLKVGCRAGHPRYDGEFFLTPLVRGGAGDIASGTSKGRIW